MYDTEKLRKYFNYLLWVHKKLVGKGVPYWYEYGKIQTRKIPCFDTFYAVKVTYVAKENPETFWAFNRISISNSGCWGLVLKALSFFCLL